MEDHYELHQAGYLGSYYIISEREANQPRTIVSSDRTIAVGTRAAMEAALRLMLVGSEGYSLPLL